MTEIIYHTTSQVVSDEKF